MTTENPWREIEPPSIAHSVNARRVDAELPWHFFWARGADRGVLLTLRHAAESAPAAPLPKLRDIEVTPLSSRPHQRSDPCSQAARPRPAGHIPHALPGHHLRRLADRFRSSGRVGCTDEDLEVAPSAQRRQGHCAVLQRSRRDCLERCSCWKRLLLPRMGASAAVAAWRGPLGSPKDFEVGRVAIEVKTRRGGATPSVAITSEDQLDESGVDSLFLYVIELDDAPADAVDGLTIGDVSDRVRERLLSLDPGAAVLFDTLLSAAGLRPEDDYSNSHWLEGLSRLYLVTGEFPRIAPE